MTFSKAPSFQFYPSDWLADEHIQAMSLAEEGCYIRLLCYCWREGSIPAELTPNQHLCKGASASVMRAVLQRFVPHPDDKTRLVHKRLDAERVKQEAWQKKCVKGGQRSAKSSKHHKARGLGGKFGTELTPNRNPVSGSVASPKHNRTGLTELTPNSSSSTSSSTSKNGGRSYIKNGNRTEADHHQFLDNTFQNFAVQEYAKSTKTELPLPFDAYAVIVSTVVDSPTSRTVWKDVLDVLTCEGLLLRPSGPGIAVDRYKKEMLRVAEGKRIVPAERLPTVAEMLKRKANNG
jgi:uncharacterized protein YdaU (DUF1376 family)